MPILLIIGVGIVAFVLIRLWTGAMNVSSIENQSLADVESKHPYLPSLKVMAGGLVATAAVIGLSMSFGKTTAFREVIDSSTAYRSLFVFLAIVAFGIFDQLRWHGSKDRYRYFFAFVLGTIVTWILIAFKRALFETGIQQDPFLGALGVVCVVVAWKFLFGPWSASIKSTVLGTFVFWVAYAILRQKNGEELLAIAMATIVAMVPVVIWCKLFLSYHKQRLSYVFLAFFAGMLSTAPILFYHELMTRSIQLNFFLFKVTPLSFGTSSNAFVRNTLLDGASGKTTTTIVLTTLVTYLIVGTIEEFSKYWVLRHSSKTFFRSIDDVMQLAIIVAIGFAFAENLLNPTYFVGFVRNYLIRPETPLWGVFIGNVVGRSVLTNMVHILSTGVLGYFFGLAFFASPLLRDQFAQGKVHPVINAVRTLLDLRTELVYGRFQMTIGLLIAFILHGIFNFTVSLPDALPGNPGTIGALIGAESSSFLNGIAITLIPAVLYVVGGLWLLVYLFARKEDMKEFGTVVDTQAFVQ